MIIAVSHVLAWLRAHPLATTAAGGASGFFTWLLQYGEGISLLLKLVGGFFGAALTILCFVLALPRAVRFVRRWRKLGFAKADGDEPPFLPGK